MCKKKETDLTLQRRTTLVHFCAVWPGTNSCECFYRGVNDDGQHLLDM